MKKGIPLTIFVALLVIGFLYIVGLYTENKISPSPAPAPSLQGASTNQSSTIPTSETAACVNLVCATLSCSVAYSEVPAMEMFAKNVAQLCEENYLRIKQILPNDSLQPPYQFVMRKELAHPGETQGAIVYLSSEWFTTHPTDDFGAVIHEMAHVFQAYPPNQPSWLVEGIADYVRYALGYQNTWSYAHCGPGSESYTSGYWCSAAFLQYVERLYDKDIISKLDAELKKGAYNDALFKTYTGKTLEELWQECKAADCKEN